MRSFGSNTPPLGAKIEFSFAKLFSKASKIPRLLAAGIFFISLTDFDFPIEFADLHCVLSLGAAQHHFGNRDDLPGDDYSRGPLHVAGLFPRPARRDRRSRTYGRVVTLTSPLENYSAAVITSSGIGVALCLHDRMERVPSGLHVTG